MSTGLGEAPVSAPSTGNAESSAPQTGNITHQYMGRDNDKPAESRTGEGSANGDQSNQQKQKPLSRYERTKRQRERERAELDRGRAQLAKEREEFEQSRKPKRNYSLQDLQRYRKDWEQEGRYDLVEAADREIQAIQQEEAAKFNTQRLPVRGTPEHKAEWERAEQELFNADGEFMRQGTRLDTKLREIFNSPEGDSYRDHPRGIIAAYHRAKMGILEEDLAESKNENAQLREELKQYKGYTSIGAGVSATKPGSSKIETLHDFSRLPAKEMKKHLMANVGKGAPFIN